MESISFGASAVSLTMRSISGWLAKHALIASPSPRALTNGQAGAVTALAARIWAARGVHGEARGVALLVFDPRSSHCGCAAKIADEVAEKPFRAGAAREDRGCQIRRSRMKLRTSGLVEPDAIIWQPARVRILPRSRRSASRCSWHTPPASRGRRELPIRYAPEGGDARGLQPVALGRGAGQQEEGEDGKQDAHQVILGRPCVEATPAARDSRTARSSGSAMPFRLIPKSAGDWAQQGHPAWHGCSDLALADRDLHDRGAQPKSGSRAR